MWNRNVQNHGQKIILAKKQKSSQEIGAVFLLWITSFLTVFLYLKSCYNINIYMKKRGAKKSFFRKTNASVIYIGFLSLLLMVAGASLTVRMVFGADGSGTNTVSPTTAVISSTGNTHTFTYTASETMNSGGIFIDVPVGFSAAQGTAGTAGYTTVASAAGTIATVKDNADSTTGWSAGSACTNGLSADAVTKQEGTASLSCANRNESNNDRWYKNITSENWASYTKVGFWIRTSSALAANQLSFDYDNSTNLASVLESVNLPALSANTWTYVVLNFGATTRTAILSYGFRNRSASTLDNVTVKIDDILLGPGSPTFTNGDIYARILQLTAGQTIVATYGSGGGASGVVAPSSPGVYTFTTQSRISDAGTLANIGTHPTITVAAEPTSQYALNNPGDTSVGTRLGYTVERRDQYGVLVTSGTETVYLYSSSSSASKKFYNASSGGSIITSITIGAGSSSANFWYYDETPGTYTITTSDSSPTPDGTTGIDDATDSVTISVGATSLFLLNDPGDMTVSTRLGYTVTRKDQFGNPVTSGTETVYLYSTSSGANKRFYNASSGGSIITSVTIGAGSSSANFWYYDETAGTYIITASDNASAPDSTIGIDDAMDPVTVSVAAIVATKFTIYDPADTVVGGSVTVTIRAEDNSGNLDTTYQNDVTLVLSGSATGGGLVNIVNGIGTKIITDSVAETVNLTLSDTQSTGLNVSSTQDVVFSNITTATKFLIDDPSDTVIGGSAVITIRAVDNSNNLDLSYQSDVTLVLNGSATGGGLVNIVNGIGTKTITDNTAETVTLSLSDTQSTGLSVSSTQNIVFANATVATKFIIIDPADTVVGGSAVITIRAVDNSGNLDTTYQNDVTLVLSGSATGGGLVSITNGAGTKTITDSVAETVNLTLTDSQSTGLNVSSTQDIVFSNANPAVKFTIIDPSNTVVGGSVEVTIRAEDGGGNLDTSYQNDVTLVASGSATGEGLVNIVNGIGTKTITDALAETVDLSLSDTESTFLDTSSAQNIVFSNANPATKFIIIDPSDTVVNRNATITIYAVNDSNIIDISYQSDITLVASGSATGEGLVDVVNGVGTKTITDAVAETVVLNLSDTEGAGLNASSAQNIVFYANETLLAEAQEEGKRSMPSVRFYGLAYPGAEITLLEKIGENLSLKNKITASSDGSFEIKYVENITGVRTYGILIKDKNGISVPVKFFTLELSIGSSTEIEIFAQPTMSLVRQQIALGEKMGIYGFASPGKAIEIDVDGRSYKSNYLADDADGSYKIELNIDASGIGVHTIKTRQINDITRQTSDWSTQQTVTMLKTSALLGDLNGDEKITISDWSIFLSIWGRGTVEEKKRIDLNGDGKINISDFSLFIINFKK
jgi:hypothetical protein